MYNMVLNLIETFSIERHKYHFRWIVFITFTVFLTQAVKRKISLKLLRVHLKLQMHLYSFFTLSPNHE